MITALPNISDTSRYTATQLAELLEVSTETIRRYRVAGALKARMNRANRRFFFTGKDVKRFWQIL